jgi:hypothetical protein
VADRVVGAAVDQAAYAVLDHRVEQGRRGDDVRRERVGKRELTGVAGHVHHRIEARLGELGLEHVRDRVGVGAVGGVPAAVDPVRLRHQVEADHFVAAVRQSRGEDPADAAGGAGEEYSHGTTLSATVSCMSLDNTSRRLRFVVLLLAVLLVGMATPSVAGSVVARARNANKVDGLKAVKSTASLTKRRGRLVATDKTTGLLPNDLIGKAPDADRIDGVDSAELVRGATVLHKATTCPFSGFLPEGSGITYDTFLGQRFTLTGGHVDCPLDLPVNAVVTSLTVRGYDDDSGAHNLGCTLVRDGFTVSGPDTASMATAATTGASASYQTVSDQTVALPVVLAADGYYLDCVLGTNAQVAIISATVAYDVTAAGTTPQ